ncbi:MAG: YiiD C-terminal domain-containing protein [Gammaproteobacteria bacterium]
MSPSELEKYLHDHIPISKAMEVCVVQVQPEAVILSAPLAPNINHRDTVFGGSASAVAILAAWSLLHIRLSGEGIASRLVIQSNTMSYERPIDGTFTAEAAIENAEAWKQFLRMFRRRGKARIKVTSVLHFGGQVAGRLEGEFVALGTTEAQPIIPPVAPQ